MPLIEHLAKDIEEKLPQKDPILQKELTYSLFDQFELTNREKEIAYGWLENKNVPEIAGIYGISQSTVRTFIKKIYAKRELIIKEHFLRNFHRFKENRLYNDIKEYISIKYPIVGIFFTLVEFYNSI